MHDDLKLLLAIGIIYVLSILKSRDFYIVIREFRVVSPGEFGKGKRIDSSYIHYFNDYSAAKAFCDLHDTYAKVPMYEDRQNINYLYAVPALTAKGAIYKMKKKVHHEAKILAETPYSTLSYLKKHWDDERKSRAELELMRAERKE